MSKLNRRGLLGLLGLGIATPAISKALPPSSAAQAQDAKVLWSAENTVEQSSYVFEADSFRFANQSPVMTIMDSDGRIGFQIMEDGTIRGPNIKADGIAARHRLEVDRNGHVIGIKASR